MKITYYTLDGKQESAITIPFSMSGKPGCDYPEYVAPYHLFFDPKNTIKKSIEWARRLYPTWCEFYFSDCKTEYEKEWFFRPIYQHFFL